MKPRLLLSLSFLFEFTHKSSSRVRWLEYEVGLELLTRGRNWFPQLPFENNWRSEVVPTCACGYGGTGVASVTSALGQLLRVHLSHVGRYTVDHQSPRACG